MGNFVYFTLSWSLNGDTSLNNLNLPTSMNSKHNVRQEKIVRGKNETGT